MSFTILDDIVVNVSQHYLFFWRIKFYNILEICHNVIRNILYLLVCPLRISYFKYSVLLHFSHPLVFYMPKGILDSKTCTLCPNVFWVSGVWVPCVKIIENIEEGIVG